MTRSSRLALLLVPVAAGLCSSTLPGHAQSPSSSRYAFADTTLVRDTLGLRFDRLFPLADSLRLPPDTLRALSIRYRLSLARLVDLADSLAVPVDSVGAVLLREQYNPLAASSQNMRSFHYGSTYNIGQTSSTWSNNADYNLVMGAVFVRNTTSINMDRYRAGGGRSLRQTRSSVTEAGWRFSPNLSLGSRANLERFNSHDPGSISNEGETKDELQLSMRSRQQPGRGLSSELNLFSGVLDLTNSRQEKRGITGDLSGRLRIQRGGWLTHDVDGQLNGNLARTRLPTSTTRLNTRDVSTNLRGTLGVFPSSPLGLNLNYTLRNVRVETPIDSGRIQQLRTESNGADLTMRLRRDTDRYLNLIGRVGRARQATGAALGSESTRRDLEFRSDGRYALAGWGLEAQFANTHSRSEFPERVASGGYQESLYVRSVRGTLTRNLGARLTAKASGEVSLSSYRYRPIGVYPTLPVDRDQYRQSYRIDGLYARSSTFNTGVTLEVTRQLYINIPSASTAANNQDRVYRAEWRWSYRLLPGLTATQQNLLSADYVVFDFLPTNNRLSLDYGTATTLNAVLTKRLNVNVTHNARTQPSGRYLRQADGLSYLAKSDENQNYTLRAIISYTPTPAFALTLQPDYQANDRSGTLNGEEVPQRRSRTLNFSGGASLNMPIGRRGRLTGDIRRSYRADRSITYASGVANASPRSETDFWNGSLQLSWDL